MTNIAVVGCGNWGKNLVRNMNNLGALRAVVDETETGRKLAAELAPAAKITTNLEDVLADDQIDGVVVATPAETHFSVTKQALEANKDVFCEKPLALQYKKGQELLQIAESRNKILMVGHLLEYHPAVQKLTEMCHQGDLGKIFYVYSNRLNLGKIRREENILWSFAPHDIAIILRLMGMMPYEVIATGGAYVQPNIADTTITQFLFPNGVRAHIFVSWLHPFKEQRFVVVGEKNIISFDDVNKKLVLHHQHVNFDINQAPIPVRGEGENIEYPTAEPLRAECQAFLDAIATRKQPLTDGKSALQVLQLLQAAQRSLITNGKAVSVLEEIS
ncbi:Gfo/Idh/MocA family oxidoreductase [Anaerolineales bacterium HSG24]|nr:Gfo/Idh/MocA family oxidoreductase [Anaerolineales bacterium HSG24]